MRNYRVMRVMKLDDVGFLRLEVDLNAVISVENREHSGSGKYWISLPRGSEVWCNQEMWDNSNAEVEKTTSERLDSYLVLGKASLNSPSQCSDISLIETAPSAGKERVMTNLCSLLALRIRLSGSKISWKYSSSGFLLVLVLLAVSISHWSQLPKFLSGVARACTTCL